MIILMQQGTNKEFISDEIPPIKEAVKNALQKCCVQLRSKILKRKTATVVALEISW